jgi:hypothetical protein
LWKAFDEKTGSPSASDSTKPVKAGPEENPKTETINEATAGTKVKDGKWKPVAKPGLHPPACCSADKEEKK